MATENIRNFAQIKTSYIRLVNKGFPQEKALNFASGYLPLERYQHLLNDAGQKVFEQAKTVIESPRLAADNELRNQFDAVLSRLPSVQEPRLDLFISPSANLSPAEKQALIELFNNIPDRGENYRILQVSQGCPNQCLMCSFDAPARVVHMPYPMVLAVAREFINPKTDLSFYFDNDPFAYRDTAFNADLGDIMLKLRSEGFLLRIRSITHGWASGDKYAAEAAEKYAAAGARIGALSVHLLHSQIVAKQNDRPALDHLLDKFAQRFRQALQLLNPAEIRRYGLSGPRVPEVLSINYIRRFFLERIDTENNYLVPRTDHTIYPEGRGIKLIEAFDSGFMDTSIVGPGETVIFRPDGRVEVREKRFDAATGRNQTGAKLFPRNLFSGQEYTGEPVWGWDPGSIDSFIDKLIRTKKWPQGHFKPQPPL